MARILMVDDDREFAEAGKAVLEAKGHSVSMAHNVKDAELIIDKEAFDIIFLDIMMQEADDGIALAARLKAKGLPTPVIMLSGVSKVTGYDYGSCDEVLPCAGFLEKPVSPEDLINKVNSITGK
ncbi:MAG: response regulator [Candidatus Omnitrophica bacterium]|nr:response regulator [Candidatus Omnitrophota bacterium]